MTVIDKSRMQPQMTQSLFLEAYRTDRDIKAVYTLKDEDYQGLPSLKRLYLEEEDPTEYTFALKYFLSWDHWERVCRSWFFKPYIKAWRKELEIKIKAKALKNIMAEAENKKSKNAYTANRFLLQGGWVDKETYGKGRPSKEDVNKAATMLAETQSRIDEDFNRMELN